MSLLAFFVPEIFLFQTEELEQQQLAISYLPSPTRASAIACVKNLVINACRFLMKNSYSSILDLVPILQLKFLETCHNIMGSSFKVPKYFLSVITILSVPTISIFSSHKGKQRAFLLLLDTADF